MLLLGDGSSVSRDIADLYPTREQADAALAEILHDEPSLTGMIWVEPVELVNPSPN